MGTRFHVCVHVFQFFSFSHQLFHFPLYGIVFQVFRSPFDRKFAISFENCLHIGSCPLCLCQNGREIEIRENWNQKEREREREKDERKGNRKRERERERERER